MFPRSRMLLRGTYRPRALQLAQRAYGIYRSGGVSLLARSTVLWIRRRVVNLRPAPPTDDPREFFAQREPSEAVLALQRTWSRQHGRIQFSLLTTLNGAEAAWLEELIGSLQAQTYPHWQLCLAVGEGESKAIQRLVEEQSRAEQRIRVVPLAENCLPHGGARAALEASGGDYVGLLDQTDRLAPFALYEVARLLQAHPDCDLVYSDEATFARQPGDGGSVILKPDFSPEMLLGQNYISRFTAVRSSLVRELGGFRPEYGTAQDWDLYLRVAESSRNIRHLDSCLYHRRVPAASAPTSASTARQTDEWQRRVVVDHLARQGLEASATKETSGTLRVSWPLDEEPLVSIIIPSRDKPELIRQCIRGLLHDTQYARREIIIVDNGSTDDQTLRFYEELEARPDVTIVPFPSAFNYSAMCNAGAAAARGQLLLFLNNDIEVLHPDWLTELVRWATRPGVGVVGAKLLFANRRLQHAGIVLGLQGLCGHVFHNATEASACSWGTPGGYRNLLAVTGACQLVTQEAFEAVGGFDEGYTVGYSDVELCLRIWREGYRVVYTPHAKLVHHECSTRPRVDPVDDARRFAHYLHSIRFTRDPYYNEQLAADSAIPRLQTVAAPRASDVVRREIERYLDDSPTVQAGEYLRKIYHSRPDVRATHPEAYLPLGMERFLGWVRHDAVREYPDLAEAEIQAYCQQVVNEAGRNLAEMYSFNLDWQRRFPLALTAFGRAEFLKAINTRVDLPQIYSPIEELRLLARIRPDVQTLLKRAAASWEGRRDLLDWVRDEGRAEYGLNEWWIRSLEQLLEEEALAVPGVNFLGHLSYQAGLGAAARGYLQALQTAGVACACRNVPHGLKSDELLGPEYLKGDVYDTTIMVFQPEVLLRKLSWLMPAYRATNYRIGIWYWELEKFPEEWLPAFRCVDEIWAPTQFIANTLAEVSPVPVRRLLHPVETSAASPVSKAELGIPEDHFVFLYAFDISSVLERKNPFAVIDAFRRAFSPSDKVTLLLKVGAVHNDPQGFARLKKACCGLPVRFLTASMSRPRLYGLMQACDCYISLHRSEGFGLTMAESMLLGKPVIATNYSGNVDFMTPESSLLVDYQMREVPPGLPFYKAGNTWAHPSVEQAAQHMRWVYSNPQAAKELGRRAQQHIRKVLSPESTGAAMRRRLLEIQESRQLEVCCGAAA